jgi:SSS family solute:Na+ symporter
MLIIIGLFVIAGVYSIYGGLASVAWTDVMQVTFLVGGGLITAYVALSEMGKVLGSDALGAFGTMFTDLTTGEHINDTHFHLIIQESHNQSAFNNVPGIAAVVGGVWLTNLGYWGFNQYIIQKGLAAKSIDEAKKGLVFAGFLKILIPFIVVIPGVCAYYIMQNPDTFASMNLQGMIERSDDAYPWLIRNFTPTGIKGLSFAALAAAIISSLASMFNSTSTLFTMDIYKKYINPEAKDKTLVNVGRIVALCSLIIAAIAVKPLLGGLDQAFQYIQEYSGFIYPGIITVFGLGLLWKRASSKAAVWTAILTIPMGVLFKVVLPDLAFQFRAGYIFIILVCFFILVSYLDNKYVSCEVPSEEDCSKMKLWANILGSAGLIMIVAALIIIIMGKSTSVTEYLNDIGIQAFIFFGVLVGCNAIWLRSNAIDRKQDEKALPINLNLFATTRGYTYGTIGIAVITILLYAILW